MENIFKKQTRFSEQHILRKFKNSKGRNGHWLLAYLFNHVIHTTPLGFQNQSQKFAVTMNTPPKNEVSIPFIPHAGLCTKVKPLTKLTHQDTRTSKQGTWNPHILFQVLRVTDNPCFLSWQCSMLLKEESFLLSPYNYP